MIDEDLKALLDANAAETRRHFEDVAARLTAVEGLTAENRQHAEGLAAENRQHAEGLSAENRNYAEQLAAELRHHFDITSEGTRHEIRLVAEAVLQVDEKLDREAADIRHEMRSGFVDTQAMIKFSHGELDSRIRVLEQ